MKSIYAFLGVELAPVSHTERIVSGIGGFVSIFSIYVVSQWALDSGVAAAIIIASMGSSAVLIFAVPHGPLSQPWPVLGGHVVSAVAGVASAQTFPDPFVAAGMAVGLAITGMYYLRCVHPPGGATALTAVVGGDAVHELGYQLVITPVALNSVIIVAVGILFNLLFVWRQYPVFLHRLRLAREQGAAEEHPVDVAHGDFVYALSQLDSFVDVTEDELLRIYELATRKSQEPTFDPAVITVGNCYSNGKYGGEWSVRQVVDESPGDDPDGDMIIYKVVAGQGRRSSGYATRKEFLNWARHQVVRDEESWKRLGAGNS